MSNLCRTIAQTVPQKNNLWISLTGGGGKTSLMQALASFYKENGKTVLMTTTTKIQSPLFFKWQADRIIVSEAEILSCGTPECPQTVLYAEKSFDIKKLQSPRTEILNVLKQRFDVVICEADGARQLPLKIHTDRDPVIPEFSDYTICIAGAWACGDVASNQTCGSDSLQIVDGKFIAQMANSENGFFKGTKKGERLFLVNGTDVCSEEQLNIFSNIQWPEDCAIIFGSVKNNETVR